MSHKVASKTSSPTLRKTAKSSAPPKRPASSQSHAPARKSNDHAKISEEAGRAQGASQSKHLVNSLGSNFSAPAKGTQAIDGNKTLRRGEGMTKSSDSVKQMQESLIKAGFGKELGSTGADGKFGAKTQEAVRKFQEKTMGKGAVDGVVGAKTHEALNKGAAHKPEAAGPAKTQPDAKTQPGAARPDAKTPGVSPARSPQEHLLGLLDKGTNRNRITNMNPAFAKDLSGMMKELQEKHQFQPRLTSGYRPGHGKSNHHSGMAADFTSANRRAISDDQLKMMRQVAAKHGLKILDERNHGYNADWSGSHLHVSRTGR